MHSEPTRDTAGRFFDETTERKAARVLSAEDADE